MGERASKKVLQIKAEVSKTKLRVYAANCKSGSGREYMSAYVFDVAELMRIYGRTAARIILNFSMTFLSLSNDEYEYQMKVKMSEGRMQEALFRGMSKMKARTNLPHNVATKIYEKTLNMQEMQNEGRREVIGCNTR